jgi:hypothetical protein
MERAFACLFLLFAHSYRSWASPLTGQSSRFVWRRSGGRVPTDTRPSLQFRCWHITRKCAVTDSFHFLSLWRLLYKIIAHLGPYLAMLLDRGHCCGHTAAPSEFILTFVEGTQFEFQQGTWLRCLVFLWPALTLKCATTALLLMLSVSSILSTKHCILQLTC